MIVDVNFERKHVLLVGGERETERKVHMFIDARADVTLICPFLPESLKEVQRTGRLTYVEGALEEDLSLLDAVSTPIHAVVVATAWGPFLEEVQALCRREHALLYVVDGAEHSDFIQPALRVVGEAQVAVSTGGKSPVMAAKLADRFAALISKVDLELIELHDVVRLEAMKRGMGALERRDLLRALAEDAEVRELLDRGRLSAARKRAFVAMDAAIS